MASHYCTCLIRAVISASPTRQGLHLVVMLCNCKWNRRYIISAAGQLLCVCVWQTQPLYLAQLIFLMPQSRSTSFMEMVVFSLFNYGSDRREAFLLLQLFTEALRYEIR